MDSLDNGLSVASFRVNDWMSIVLPDKKSIDASKYLSLSALINIKRSKRT